MNLDKPHTTKPLDCATLDPKMVADAIKEEWMFMRKLQVYHEVLVSDLDNSGLKPSLHDEATRTRVCAADPFIRAPTGCARNHE